VRRKFQRGIEADAGGVTFLERQRADEVGVLEPHPHARLAPALRPPANIRDDAGAIDRDDRPSVDADVTIVLEVFPDVAQKALGLVGAIGLAQQHLAFQSVPAPRPVLVRPHEEEAKAQVALAQEATQRRLEQRLAAEPVEVEHEPGQAVVASDVDLALQSVFDREIVEAQVAGKPRLVMSDELRQCPDHVGPFGEPRAPKAIVFLAAVKLRQIEGDALAIQADLRLCFERPVFPCAVAEQVLQVAVELWPLRLAHGPF
jgi:hypothetical protein